MIRDRHPDTDEGPDGKLYIGYWTCEHEPLDHVDSSWDAAERDLVIDYLLGGITVLRWVSPSTCKICGKPNGDQCVSDGTWVWPSGLSHYLRRHAVRVPQSFVDHVRTSLRTSTPGRMGEAKVRALIELAGGDPDTEVANLERMRRLDPILDRVKEMATSRDLLVLVHFHEIVKRCCAIINCAEEDFDPALLRGILSIAAGIGANESDKWNRYTNAEAPLVNLRLIQANLPPTGEYDS